MDADRGEIGLRGTEIQALSMDRRAVVVPEKGEHGSYKGRRLCRTCPLILHLLFNKWHNDLDQRARIRLALDDQPTAEQSHSLADTFHPKVAVFD